jgi:hypothetical protein
MPRWLVSLLPRSSFWLLRRKCHHGPDAGIAGALSGAQATGLGLAYGIVVLLTLIANSG